MNISIDGVAVWEIEHQIETVLLQTQREIFDLVHDAERTDWQIVEAISALLAGE